MITLFVRELIATIETKNSWGKNELKTLIYQIGISVIEQKENGKNKDEKENN